jgi:hypothetical protein
VNESVAAVQARRRRPGLGCVLALALLMPAAAVSAAPSYRYLEIDYLYFDEQGRVGARLAGVLPLGQRLHLQAGHERTTDRVGVVRARQRETGLALGIRHGLSAATDLVARAGVADDQQTSALHVELGVRSMTTPNMEVAAFVRHSALDDAGSSMDLLARFALERRVALAAGIEIGRQDVLYRLGLRFAF